MKHMARFLFSPYGRTGRRLYWLFFILPLAGLVIALALSPFLLWLQGAVIARRLQDIGSLRTRSVGRPGLTSIARRDPWQR
jgi:uncharacterized membrane protein YhaH (DUF805 family)